MYCKKSVHHLNILWIGFLVFFISNDPLFKHVNKKGNDLIYLIFLSLHHFQSNTLDNIAYVMPGLWTLLDHLPSTDQTFSSLSGRWCLVGSSSPLDLCQPWQYSWFSSWEGLELHIFALDRPQTTRLLLTCFLICRSIFILSTLHFVFLSLCFVILSIKSILVSPFKICAGALILKWGGVALGGQVTILHLRIALTWFIVW